MYVVQAISSLSTIFILFFCKFIHVYSIEWKNSNDLAYLKKTQKRLKFDAFGLRIKELQAVISYWHITLNYFLLITEIVLYDWLEILHNLCFASVCSMYINLHGNGVMHILTFQEKVVMKTYISNVDFLFKQTWMKFWYTESIKNKLKFKFDKSNLDKILNFRNIKIFCAMRNICLTVWDNTHKHLLVINFCLYLTTAATTILNKPE